MALEWSAGAAEGGLMMSTHELANELQKQMRVIYTSPGAPEKEELRDQMAVMYILAYFKKIQQEPT